MTFEDDRLKEEEIAKHAYENLKFSGIDHAYRKFIRSHRCLVAVALKTDKQCLGVVEFCHLKHRGMGGTNVPDRGNGVPICTIHHTDWHTKGRKTFEAIYHLDLDACAQRLLTEFDQGELFA